MSASVLAGLAGVLVAAVATGLLARQCVRGQQAGIALWAAAALALVVALLAQIAGFATGFTPVTFRAVQLGAQFAAPLWLAWGLAEVALVSGTARFCARLASGAITVVSAVMVGTDPLTAAPFTRSWPPGSVHFQFVAHDALLLTQVVAVLMALTAAGTAAFRARTASASTGSGRDGAGYGPVVPASAAVVVAVLAAISLRFALPVNSGYPLLCGLAAALAWFAMTRVRETRSELSAAWNGQRARRYESDAPAYFPGDEPAMKGWRGRNRDEWEEPRRDRRGGRDDQGWYEPGPDNRDYPGEGSRGRRYDDRGYGYPGDPGSGYQQPAYNGYDQSGYDQAGYDQSGSGQPGYNQPGYDQPGYDQPGYDQPGYDQPGYNQAGYGRQDYTGNGYSRGDYAADAYDGAGHGNGHAPNGYDDAGYRAAYGRAAQPDAPPATAVSPGRMSYPAASPDGRTYQSADAYPPANPAVQANGAGVAQAGRPYGRISIFTLLDDKAAEFDQLAEQTAEAVRVAEPGTLVYVIHLVPKAPMQRIFYEIYRDREAFDLHERQPHNQRFAAERRAYVLATNIIELRLKYAKVAPLSPGSSQKSQMQQYPQPQGTPRGQLPPPDQPSGISERYGG